MKAENIGGAAIAALILFVSSLMTLFSANPDLTFADFSTATWVSLVGGLVVAFFKDAKANDTRTLIASMTSMDPNARSPWYVGILAGFLAMAMLSGCGIVRPDIDSTADAIAVTAADVETAAQTVSHLCLNVVPGGDCAEGAPISTGQKESLKNGLQDVLDGLSLANLALATQDNSGASSQLARTRALLSVLQAELARLEN